MATRTTKLIARKAAAKAKATARNAPGQAKIAAALKGTGKRPVQAKAKAAKPAKAAPKPAMGQRAAILEAAKAGTVPPAPDFSAMTHRSYRGKLADCVKLVEGGDLKALRAYELERRGSRAAIMRWRDLAILALEAKAAAAKPRKAA